MQGTLLEKFLTRSPTEFLRLMRSVDNSAVVGEESRREAYRYAKVVFCFILLYFPSNIFHSQKSSLYAPNLTVSILVSPELECLISRRELSRQFGMTYLTSKRTPVIKSALLGDSWRALRKSIMTSSDLRSSSTGKFLSV
jgi:hypothetical protein